MRSYCTAQGAIDNHLGWTMMEDNIRKGMYIHMYDWVIWHMERNWHNIVNQRYFNKFFLKKCRNEFHMLIITFLTIFLKGAGN